jgi:uncharacterized repeat protein (TIGR03803 family)
MLGMNLQSLTARVASILLFALAVLLTPSAQAQTYNVIHTFSGEDGAAPAAGLTIDARGRLYGSTQSGGPQNGSCPEDGCGGVFRLAQQGSGWTLTPLFQFDGPGDGAAPMARPVFGPNGLLYGTTAAGGSMGNGLVYSLRPPATACKTALCAWTETALYQFAGGSDGVSPGFGDVTFDNAGNIYGTTSAGGFARLGTVYELTPSNGGWTEKVLYSFSSGAGGSRPGSGVILDQAGNLYGTTESGGTGGCGTVYELSPVGSGWTEKVLYNFQCDFGSPDGFSPIGGLIFDAAGNLYGTTNLGGANNGGTVFELSPAGGGNWTFNVLYSLSYIGTFDFIYYGPTGSLVMDASGRLYGTTVMDGAFTGGSVFQLTPSNDGWSYTSLHDFTGGSDGGEPFGSVVFDTGGNLYGTTSVGPFGGGCEGRGCGVVWEITP